MTMKPEIEKGFWAGLGFLAALAVWGLIQMLFAKVGRKRGS